MATCKRQLMSLLLILSMGVASIVSPMATPAFASDCWTPAGLDQWNGVVQQVLNDEKGQVAGVVVAFTTPYDAKVGETLTVNGVKVRRVDGSSENPVWGTLWAALDCVPLSTAEFALDTNRNMSYAQASEISVTEGDASVSQFVPVSGVMLNTDLTQPRWTKSTPEGAEEAFGFLVLEGENAYAFAQSIDGSQGGPVYQVYGPGSHLISLRHGTLMVFSSPLAFQPELFEGFRRIEPGTYSQIDGQHLFTQDPAIQENFLSNAGGNEIAAQLNWVKAHNAQVTSPQPPQGGQGAPAQVAQAPATSAQAQPTSTGCYTVAELDNKFGIVRSVADNGLLKESGRLHGAVLNLTGEQITLLTNRGWTIQGTNPTIRSAWAPERCRPLS